MSVEIRPILAHERQHCAYCSKPLQPDGLAVHQSFLHQHKGPTPAEQLEAFTTNRRVVAVRRSWHPLRDDNDKVIGRKCWSITITYMPERASDWGVDGLFCTNRHAHDFAHAAYHAGYRRKRKEAA